MDHGAQCRDRGSRSQHPEVRRVRIPALATVAVILRLLSRRIVKQKWKADDYAIICALVSFLRPNARLSRS